MTRIKVHSNAPKRLVKLFRKCEDNYSETARIREINPGHVYSLLKYGREPKRDDLRVKLFLKQDPEQLARKREERKQKQKVFNEQVEQYIKQVMEAIDDEE